MASYILTSKVLTYIIISKYLCNTPVTFLSLQKHLLHYILQLHNNLYYHMTNIPNYIIVELHFQSITFRCNKSLGNFR